MKRIEISSFKFVIEPNVFIFVKKQPNLPEKNMRKVLSLIILLFSLKTAVFAQKNNKKAEDTQEKERIILISTELGDIKIKLFNETPQHRDNFIKLAEAQYYDTSIFHRVIKSFMIQGGGGKTGMSDPGYTIPAEILPKFFHKKGMLAAARMGDNVNPSRSSSGSQFYIVQGQVFKPEDLTGFENRINMESKQKIFNEIISRGENQALRSKFIQFQQQNNVDSLNALSKIIEPIIEAEYSKITSFKFSEDQVKTYTTIGGSPHLDGAYTIFGEVIEGLEVVDKIGDLEVGEAAKPKKDFFMKVKVLK